MAMNWVANPITTFKQAEEYLQTYIPTGSTEKFPGHLGILRMKEFLSRLDNPQNKFESIHIAGTSGKGSTAYFASKILQESGKKVGLHTSPHLQTIRERIKIDDQMISEHEFIELIAALKPIIEGMSDYEYGKPSYFEVLVAATFVYFAEQNVDVAVIEAGLGGKFDGTNVLDSTVTILTSVGLDHTHILGNTKQEILADKMQIIKNGNHVAITGVTEPDLLEALEQHCHLQNTRLLKLNQDILIEPTAVGLSESVFTFGLDNRKIENLKIGSPGSFQIINAGIAIAACLEFARAEGFEISDHSVREALASAHFPGRFEVTSKDPLVIMDGAHNADKMRALVKSLQDAYPRQKFSVVFGLKKGKDAAEMLKILKPVVQEITITQFSRSTDMGLNLYFPAKELYEIAKLTLNCPVFLETDAKTAMETNLENAKNNQDGILVTGSLYLVGELRPQN